jgi:hypothetical protein
MQRRRARQAGLGLAIVLAVVAAIWLSWSRRHASVEAALTGAWRLPAEPDGSWTQLVLRDGRTCQIRWFDAASNLRPSHPIQNGKWWVSGDRMLVDTRRKTRTPWFAGVFGSQTTGKLLEFRIEDGVLVYGWQGAVPNPEFSPIPLVRTDEPSVRQIESAP